MSQYLSQLAGKRIVVTGGVGSVGRAIVEKLAASPVGHVRVIDNNESGLFDMEMDFAGRKGSYGNYVRLRHGSTYQTAYAHMKSIAKGITGRPGETRPDHRLCRHHRPFDRAAPAL